MVAPSLKVQHLALEEFGADIEGTLDRVNNGEEIRLTLDGRPIARILPLSPAESAALEARDAASRAREIEAGFAALKKVPGLTHDQILKELHEEREIRPAKGAGSDVA